MFITINRTVMSMADYTRPAREADKQLDQFAHYKQKRRSQELQIVRDVYTPKVGNHWHMPLKKKI